MLAAELEFYLIDPGRSESGLPKRAVSARSGATEMQGKVLSLDKFDAFLVEAFPRESDWHL